MHGVINLDKAKGITSQEAVTALKQALKVKKAGHAGTLDPIATGVLLVLVGEATKIARFLSDLDKEYVAELKLGERTDTLDADGRVIETKEVPHLTENDIEQALSRFRGEIRQTPPMYSALKRNGTPLYKLARKGMAVERQERIVNILRLELLRFNTPFLEIKINCSKGTYIRSLADDIGQALGTGAHITALRRTAIGRFKVENAVSLDAISAETLIPIDDALSHLREIVLTARDYTLISKGSQILFPERLFADGEFLRLKTPEGKLFAVGRVSAKDSAMPKIMPERVLHI